MRFLGKAVVIILSAVGAVTLLGMALLVVAALQSRPQPLPARVVLSLNLDAEIAEALPDDPIARLATHRGYVMSDLVQALDRAARDPRVVGLVARLDGARMSMATAQELRDAVLAFRK
jgi:protease-4